MGKKLVYTIKIIDNTQLQQKDVGEISSNVNLILAETAYRPPFGHKFNPVGGRLNIDGLS